MKHFRTCFFKINSESGATLIFIIIAMVVVAILGVGLYTLTMTSVLNQAEAQKAAKAYYISESCVRIAASEYKAAAAANKNSTLVALHNKTFTMPNNQGSCTVEIYPYWFYAPTAINYAIGATSIALYFPGAVPPVHADGTTAISLTLPTNVNAKLKKRGSGEVYIFSSATFGDFNAANGGTLVTFTLSTPLTSAINISAGDEFYLGDDYTPTAVTLSAGGNLILNIAITDTNDLTAKIFPPEKGSIFVESTGNISQYSYDKRVINTTSSPHTVTLTKIQAISGTTPTWTVTISNTSVYMGKSLGLRSTSTYGQ